MRITTWSELLSAAAIALVSGLAIGNLIAVIVL